VLIKETIVLKIFIETRNLKATLSSCQNWIGKKSVNIEKTLTEKTTGVQVFARQIKAKENKTAFYCDQNIVFTKPKYFKQMFLF